MTYKDDLYEPCPVKVHPPPCIKVGQPFCQGPSRQRALVTAILSFFLWTLIGIPYGGLGVFLVEFADYYDGSKSKAAWIGAFAFLVGNLSGVGLGMLVKRFGCRVTIMTGSFLISVGYFASSFASSLPLVCFTFAAIPSVGFTLLIIAGGTLIQQAFDKHRGFVTGLSLAGISMGMLVWPPVSRLLIDTYSAHGALIVMSGVAMQGMVVGALVKPLPKSTKPDSHKIKDLEKDTNRQKCCKVQVNATLLLPFIVYLMGSFFMEFGHGVALSYTPSLAEDLRVSRTHGALLLSIIGLSGGIARPLMGLFADRKFFHHSILFGISSLLTGTANMLGTFARNYVELVCYSVGFGLASAGYMATLFPIVVGLVGVENVEIANGALYAIYGLADLTMNPICGYLMDSTGSARYPFLVFGALQALGGALVMFVPRCQQIMRTCPQRNLDQDADGEVKSLTNDARS